MKLQVHGFVSQLGQDSLVRNVVSQSVDGCKNIHDFVFSPEKHVPQKSVSSQNDSRMMSTILTYFSVSSVVHDAPWKTAWQLHILPWPVVWCRMACQMLPRTCIRSSDKKSNCRELNSAKLSFNFLCLFVCFVLFFFCFFFWFFFVFFCYILSRQDAKF